MMNSFQFTRSARLSLVFQRRKDWATILPALIEMKTEALTTVPASLNAGTSLAERRPMLAKVYSGLLTGPGIETIAKLAGEIAVARASN